ncbi:MAG: hypothetical protein V3V35_05660, partial [Dehalococcoidia bacterium]
VTVRLGLRGSRPWSPPPQSRASEPRCYTGPMGRRLALLALLLALAAAACGTTVRTGRDGVPPLAPQDQWARQRVEAVLRFYDFTEGATEAIRRLRVHHVLGRPGWFGSAGYQNWIGVGQARPSSIVQEISHSLWGPFPVVGRPDLGWDTRPGEQVSPGLQAQRRDLDTFMQQPPDAFEPLRARLRLIPDLVSGSDFPGLYHLGEAEIIYFTGGNLNLVPPILRKYYGPLLAPGRFASWDDAIRWYLRLPGEQRRIVDAYFGVGSMPLEAYDIGPDPNARADDGLAALAVREERQRLLDFIEQFGLYFKPLDAQGAVVDDVRFWRGYLRDTLRVFDLHPDVANNTGPRGRQIAEAFQFLLDLEALTPEERPEAARERILVDPFVISFTPAIDNRTLSKLVTGDATDAERQAARLVRAALDSFHLRVLELAVTLQRTAAEDSAEAARSFDGFLRSLTERERESMNFILEVLSAVDRTLTRSVLNGITPEMARVVNDKGPAFTRFLLEPEELVRALGFSEVDDPARLAELAVLLNENVSATAHIDHRFLESVYRRIVQLGESDPGEALRLFAETGLLVEPFLVNMPDEAAALIARDPAAAAAAFETANPVRLPPARAIYRLVQADPGLAARITLLYDDRGSDDVVDDALFFFAYDLPRKQAQPALPISLEKDARYLEALAAMRGDDWLETTLKRAVRRSGERIEAGEVDAAFLETYRATLERSLATLDAPETRRRLEAVVDAALVGR